MSGIILTPIGKSIAENTQGSGAEFAVLSLLYETNGPVEIDEVMDATNMNDEKASMVIRRLIGKEYIKEV